MNNAKHAVVLVLGDVGRSPRMQYHALSLLENGHFVTLIGYTGEGLIPPLQDACMSDVDGACHYRGRLHVLRMKPYQPPRNNFFCRLCYYPLRLISLIYCVIYTLWMRLNYTPHTRRPVDVILVQNPPPVPTLLLVYMYCIWKGICKRHRPRFVIDWHNLGYTMFDLPDIKTPFQKKAMNASLRTVVKWYERILASMADAHLCVTQAMEDWLGENFGVHGGHVRVLYDKPPLLFCPTAVAEQHNLFRRLHLEQNEGISQWLNDMNLETKINDLVQHTLFTTDFTTNGGSPSVQLRNDRPALLISSTSWTPDEDFSILLEALDRLQTLIDETRNSKTFPKVLVLVTGKGPLKVEYLPLLNEFNKTHTSIKIYTLWLEAVDYPKLLGCATLGISLHTSTSGLDLPMKVLDMFGSQVPVCAIGFACLDELVKDGVNGQIFHNGGQLASQLFQLLEGYPNNKDSRLETLRMNIRGMKRWKENWEECARHLIVGD